METLLPSPAELYESFYGPAIFQPLAEVLVPAAGPRVGERVLDVACGTGIVARRVAPPLGPSGRVLGVDLNPAMIEVARMHPAPEGAPIAWEVDDATALALPAGSFDLVLCQQGFQFFSDRAAALRGFREALTEGGRLALALWKGIEHHPVFAAFAEVEARYLAPLGVTYDDILAPFSLGDAEEIRALLDAAGFTRIELFEATIDARFPQPETFARNMETAYAAVIPGFAGDPEAFGAYLDGVERDTRDLVRRHTEGNAVRFPMPTHIAVAVSP
jgi:ubiquinone/menaquinone biosynthesis C-methylase UbiE